jgi:hypothetical protein
MTEPQPPPDFVEERLEKIKELKKDKLGTAQKAIEYLARFEVYCGRDYKFDDAFDKASDKCYEETIRERVEKGRIRVRIEGRRPCWWNGRDPTDESGFRVKWVKGDGHTFLTPDVRVAGDDIIPVLDVVPKEERENVAEEEGNPFESMFSKAPKVPLIENDDVEIPNAVIVEEVD